MQTSTTKSQIVEAFLELSQLQNPQKITVSMISKALNINRKTFYYYFQSREMLVSWIFRRDLGHMLKDAFPQSQLIFEAKDSTPCSNYPYYVFIEDSHGGLSHDSFFIVLSNCFSARKDFYGQLLKSSEMGSLYDYLFLLYLKEIRKDILYIFKGRALGENAVNFLAELFTSAFLGQIANRIKSSNPCRKIEDIEPFNNIIHDALYFILNAEKFALVDVDSPLDSPQGDASSSALSVSQQNLGACYSAALRAAME